MDFTLPFSAQPALVRLLHGLHIAGLNLFAKAEQTGVHSAAMNRPDEDLPLEEAVRTNADDVDLLRRIGDADETALGALYDEWSHPLYSLVLSLLRDSDEAEDVVEETFWEAWRRADEYEPAHGTVSTWLLTTGRRKALERLRARKRSREDLLRRKSPFADFPAYGHDPMDDVEGAEVREKVRRALRELPPEQREALEMGYFGGLSEKEIADASGLAPETVETRMRLAIQGLRVPGPTSRGSAE
jgi:RNA polymerase sigma-70 factor (ECF subfamily)